MAKPPPDVDPEKFIIGKGGYDNLRTACPYHDEHVFRIDPAPMPKWSIFCLNLLYVAVCYGFYWLINDRSQGVPEGRGGEWIIYALAGLGIMTCTVVTSAFYYSYGRARRLGPWLIYDKQTGSVTLPRDGETFKRAEIVHLQYITTKFLGLGRVLNNDRCSELNLITLRDGVRKRWPLLRSIGDTGAFDYLLKPLLCHTDLPVVRVKDQWWGWRVTETPYTQPPGREQSLPRH